MPLGLRLKRLRENKQMSVKDLAQAVGVSRSFIYQLERDEVSPSYSTLRSMAGALGTAVSTLVGDMTPEEWLVVRKEGRKRLVTAPTDCRVELMTFLGSRNRRMQPVVLELEAGARTESLPFEHEREDLFFVIAGEVTLTIEGGRLLELKAGDSAYLLFERLAVIANPGTQPATCLWVVSPTDWPRPAGAGAAPAP